MEGTSGTTSTSGQQQAGQGQEGRGQQQQNQFSKTASQPQQKNSYRGTDVNPIKSQISDVEREVANSFSKPREEGEDQDENQEGTSEEDGSPDEAKEGRKWKLKISGREHDVTEDQLLKLASQGGRMYQAMEETAVYRKQNQQFSDVFNKITKDPESFFELGKMLGHDMDALTHNRVVKKLQYDLMDPNERRLHDLERENAKYKETHEQATRRQEEERQQQAQSRVTETTQNEVVEFFNARGGKRDPHEIADALQVKLEALAAGRDLPIAKAFEIAQTRVQRLLERKLETMTDDEIGKLSPAVKSKIRKFELSQFKKPGQSAPAERKQSPTREQPKRSMTIEEYFGEYKPKNLRG